MNMVIDELRREDNQKNYEAQQKLFVRRGGGCTTIIGVSAM